MNIAIDISPISTSSGHKVRGVGMYLSTLKDNIEVLDKKNNYTFFTDIKKLQKDIDLVHFPYFDPFFITFPLIKKYRTVITVHDVIPLTHKKEFPVGIKGKFKWGVNRRILLSSDAVIADSEASKKAIHKLLDYPEDKIFVVYLGAADHFREKDLSKNQIEEVRIKYGLPERFILYVGDVTWNKNLPRVVDAINSIGDIPLVMIGKALADSEYDSTNSWNKDKNYVLKHTDNSLFYKLGFLPDEDLVSIYKIAEALIMPSLDEGFGLPVLEAMTCGCPVITSKEGSLPEVAGQAAVYVDAYSVDDIKNKINKVFNDSDLKKELSQKSLAQSKKFSIKKMVQDTLNVYSQVNEKAR